MSVLPEPRQGRPYQPDTSPRGPSYDGTLNGIGFIQEGDYET